MAEVVELVELGVGAVLLKELLGERHVVHALGVLGAVAKPHAHLVRQLEGAGERDL